LGLQRRRRGWSQVDLAHQLRRLAESHGDVDLGVDGNMVSRWERGSRRPTPRYIRLLCQLFDLDGPSLGFTDGDQAGLQPTVTGFSIQNDNPPGPGGTSAQPDAGPPPAGILPPYRAVLAVDAESFSDRTSVWQSPLNARIKQVLEAAFHRAGLADAWQDRRFSMHTGDGYLVGLLPEHLPRLIHPFLRELDAELRERDYRRLASEPRLRLRASIHVGPLPDDGSGDGKPMRDAHRLLDSAEVRRALDQLREDQAFLAAILSRRVFEDVVAAGYTALHPSQFGQIVVTAKRFVEPGYLYVPSVGAAQETTSGAVIVGDGNVVVGRADVQPARIQRPSLEDLTRQERRVAEFAASGLSNKEIAERLWVSVSTVESHLQEVYSKLGMSSRRQLIARSTERSAQATQRIVAIGLRDENDRVLMVKTWLQPGHWQPIAGVVDSEDGSSVRAAVREVKEKADIDLAETDLRPVIAAPYDFGAAEVQFFEATIDRRRPLRFDPREVLDRRWFTVSEARSQIVFPATGRFLDALRFKEDDHDDDDQQFVARAKAGSETAWEAIVRRYHGPIRRLVWRLMMGDDVADDVVQSTFLAAFLSISQYKGDGPLLHWLLTIARKLCLSEGRRWQRRPLDVSIDSMPEDAWAALGGGAATDDPAERCDTVLDLEMALASVAEEEREAFLLRFAGYSSEEAGRIVGASAATMRSRLARAKERLVISLNGYEPSA
jgi:RNA polymerase sigma factor (sigma-70 family)